MSPHSESAAAPRPTAPPAVQALAYQQASAAVRGCAYRLRHPVLPGQLPYLGAMVIREVNEMLEGLESGRELEAVCEKLAAFRWGGQGGGPAGWCLLLLRLLACGRAGGMSERPPLTPTRPYIAETCKPASVALHCTPLQGRPASARLQGRAAAGERGRRHAPPLQSAPLCGAGGGAAVVERGVQVGRCHYAPSAACAECSVCRTQRAASCSVIARVAVQVGWACRLTR